MGIRAEAITAGLVFRNPKLFQLPASKQFFKFLKAEPEESGNWLAEHLTGRDIATIKEEQLDDLEAVSNEPRCDFDVGCLLSKKAKVELGHGTITGIINEIRTQKMVILGHEMIVPRQFTVDGDEINFSEIREISLV